MSKKYFRKVYSQTDLLGSEQDIIDRIDFINEYSPLIPSLVTTSIWENGTNYEYKQPFIRKKSFRKHNKSFLVNKLENLARDLNQITDCGFVHGDLNMKNILFDGKDFSIVDLEPSLFQIKNKMKQLMMTPPYWSFNDIQNNTVSTESDKIGFFCFCCRVFNNKFFIKNRIGLTKKRQKEFVEFLPISENEIVSMKYDDLLNECLYV